MNFHHILCKLLAALIQIAEPEVELKIPDGSHTKSEEIQA